MALPTLLNELGELTKPVVLVLDDYHLVSNAEIHGGVDFFLEHLPPRLHLVLSTRSDPPLPLARLRARGELLEVRAEDLRFSAAETATFLNDVLELGLEPADVARLHERTEGWAAGLYLAALWLRGRGDAHQFIPGHRARPTRRRADRARLRSGHAGSDATGAAHWQADEKVALHTTGRTEPLLRATASCGSSEFSTPCQRF